MTAMTPNKRLQLSTYLGETLPITGTITKISRHHKTVLLTNVQVGNTGIQFDHLWVSPLYFSPFIKAIRLNQPLKLEGRVCSYERKSGVLGFSFKYVDYQQPVRTTKTFSTPLYYLMMVAFFIEIWYGIVLSAPLLFIDSIYNISVDRLTKKGCKDLIKIIKSSKIDSIMRLADANQTLYQDVIRWTPFLVKCDANPKFVDEMTNQAQIMLLPDKAYRILKKYMKIQDIPGQSEQVNHLHHLNQLKQTFK